MMKAHLRNVRLAPKKANLVAAMIRRLPALRALAVLSRTPKKAARALEQVVKSAVTNAEHNAKQHGEDLYIKTLIVNGASSFRRGVPRARGMVRPIRKFTSHITVELGVMVPEKEKESKEVRKSGGKEGKVDTMRKAKEANPKGTPSRGKLKTKSS